MMVKKYVDFLALSFTVWHMKQTAIQYTVSQTFETFGEPSPEIYDTEADADAAADRAAGELAASFYKRDGDTALIPHYDPSEKGGGVIHESDFHQMLSDDSGAEPDTDGKMPWDDLVAEIRAAAVQIE